MTPIDQPTGPPSLSATSTSLLDRVKAKDPDAWEKLVTLYGPVIYGWCRRWGFNRTTRWTSPKRCFGQWPGRLKASAGTIPARVSAAGFGQSPETRSATTALGRAHSPQAIGGTDMQLRLADIPEASGDGSDCSQANDESAGVVRRALDVIRGDFQEQTWLAFLRTAVDGRAAHEVAGELGMTKHAVRQAKYRVLQRLREEFGNLVE